VTVETDPNLTNDPPAEDVTALGAIAAEEAPSDDAEKLAEGEGAEQAAEAAATPEGAPEAYDTTSWQMPEGVEFDAEGFAEVEPVLRDLNLSQDNAGKLMTAYAEKIVPMIQKRTVEQFDNQAAELRANLARDLQADPEVGGKKLDESRSYAAKAIAHFIPNGEDRNAFSTFLNESGLGNHPLLMRLVSGAGRAVAEASTPAGETASAPQSEAEKFYGKG
jgi:hypothetical protein